MDKLPIFIHMQKGYKTIETESSGKCVECGRELYGRPDKKFCSEECKNKFHNTDRIKKNKIKDRIIIDLIKNREILVSLLDSGRTSAELVELEAMGFKPSRITGYRKTGGLNEFDCFDLIYRQSKTRIFNLRPVLSSASQKF